MNSKDSVESQEETEELSGILSLQVQTPPFIDPYLNSYPPTEDTGDPLWSAIEAQVKKDVRSEGLRKGILEPTPGYKIPEKEFIDGIVDTIWHDVVEFPGWYFGGEAIDEETDMRTAWVGVGARGNRELNGNLIPFATDMPVGLRKTVRLSVEKILKELRDIGVEGGNVPPDPVTDDLTRYIVNWPAWYYDRYILDSIDSYFETKGMYEDIYFDDETYGTLGNLLDDGQYDGVSDAPYIYEV